MEIFNLNQVTKIVFYPRMVTDDYIWKTKKYTTIVGWFLNLFRKKDKRKYEKKTFIVEHSDWHPLFFYTREEFLEELGVMYQAPEHSKLIWKKAHVKIVFSNPDIKTVTRWFENTRDAKKFFDRLVKYTHENNLHFIDFYYDEG